MQMKMEDNQDNKSSEDSQLSEMTRLQSPQNDIQQFFLEGRVKTAHRQENTKFSLLFNFICQMLCFIHILIVQQILSGEKFSTFLVQLLNPGSSLLVLYYSLQIYSVMMKLIIIQLIFVEVVYSYQIIGFSWLNKKILKSFYIVKKIDLALSGYLLLFSWSQNLPIYLASLGIQAFYAIYMQNYIFRKDLFYATSPLHYILWTATMSALYGINIILLNIGNYLLFTVIHLILGSIILIWYSRHGQGLFANKLVTTTYLIMTAVYGSFFIGLAQQIIYGTPLFTFQNIFKLIFAFLFITLVLKLIGNKQSSFIKQEYRKELKQYEIFAFNLLEESYISKQAESLIMGILYTHICVRCINRKCPFLKERIFDPIIKMEVQTRQIRAQRDSSLRLYFKCLYEYKISQNPLSKRIKIDYSDFLYNETGKIYLLINQLFKLYNMGPNIILKVRVNKLKILIKEENFRLNDQLYEGKLDLQHIIDSQQVFSTIERDISQYLQGNIIVWKSFSEPQIDLSLLRNKISDNFKIIDRVSASWKKISKYLNIHKEWKFVYLSFMLFFKNDKTRHKQLDQANRSIKKGPQKHKVFFEETKLDREIFTPSFLFDRESFCIKTVLENGSLIIKDVSKFFQKNTHYTLAEIKGVPLNALMPESIREQHAQTVLKWIEQGYQADYNSYSVRFTHFLTKEGQQFPVLKYYKIFCNLENGSVEFICLLKNNMTTETDQIDSTDQQIYQYKKIQSQYCGMVSAVQVEQEFNPSQNKNKFVQGSNIFIKQETLMPSKQFQVIEKFKLSSRIFTAAILASIVILALMTNSDSNIISNYGVQFISFMNMFRFPVILGTNYIKSLMNVGSPLAVQSQIQSATKNMQLYASQQTTIKTLFNPALNIPTIYYPHQWNAEIQPQTYDQIDLFYVMMSAISSLNTPSINHTSLQFKQFNAFLKPAYITMMNSTRYQFHYTIESMLRQIQITTTVFIVVQAILFCIFIIIIFYFIHSAMTKMKNIFTILIDFRSKDVQKITNYWMKINRSFENIFYSTQAKKLKMQTQRLSYQSIISQSNIKAASTSKFKVMKGKRHSQYQFRLRLLIICTTIVIILLAMSIEIKMIVTNRNISNFEADGFLFLQYFPIAAIVGYGCMQKYYSINYPSYITFDPNRYANDLSSMLAFGNPSYVGNIKDTSSAYYQKQKNYFFANICVYNSAPLSTTTVNISTCETLSNGTFKQGLSAFLRYGENFANSYINGRISMTPVQLQDFTLSSTVLSAYVLDALSTWQNQFISRIQVKNQNITTISIIILIVICLIHFIANESIITNRISEEYQFICKMYEYMVPEYILIDQKVIRQKFIIEGLISQ